MKTKRFVSVFCIIAFSILSMTVVAQKGDRPINKNQRLKEKSIEVENKRVDFIVKYLEMNATEAEQFKKVYKETKDKEKDFRVTFRKEMKPLMDKKWNDLSEKEAEDLIVKQDNHQTAIQNLHKEAVLKYKKILPVAKVAKIKQAETDFKKELLKEAREKRKANTGKINTPTE